MEVLIMHKPLHWLQPMDWFLYDRDLSHDRVTLTQKQNSRNTEKETSCFYKPKI